ncbi:MAG: SDR family oxidoreductase [Desulfobacterales bacterium]|nr:MAG: SDR family oxidoreductase [Desulfobacterales bacterium]
METFSTLRNNGLKDKVVVIASQRSGKCIPSELTQTFLEEEARVYVTDSKPEILEIVAAEVEEYLGLKLTTYPFDFHEPGAVDAFVQEVRAKEGRIDVLVTEFGLLEFVPHLKPFHLQTPEEWDRQLKIILEDAFIWTRAVVPIMMDQNAGRIIHITSEAARVGTPFMSVYSAAKAAVAGFTRSLAAELGRYNITANCVSLGIQEIEDRNETSEAARAKLEKIRKLIPLRRFSEPEEIAVMVAFLASDLGSYITGQNISVAGGMVMP